MEMQEALLNLKDLESIYYIDMVMVIDATMDSPFINNIKFWQDLIIQTDSMISQYMKQYGRQSRIRLKIIYFRDYYFDGKYAAGESEAFEITNDRNQLFEFINSLRAAGGGDVPESGLEALWLAIMHAGCEKHELYRRIITLFTNAPAHPLEDYDKLVLVGKQHNCCAPVNYPEQIPHCLGDLYKEWETWNQDGRGWLFLVTPNVYPWRDMEIECEHVIRVESTDYDYNSEIGYQYQNVFDTLIEGYWCAIFGS